MGELWVTPVPVEHTVPTTGFVIHDGETGFVYSGDTGPTEAALADRPGDARPQGDHRRDRLPQPALAARQGLGAPHPEMLQQEIDKMPADLPIWIYHIKPQLYQETAEELANIDPSRIHMLEQGKTYTSASPSVSSVSAGSPSGCASSRLSGPGTGRD